MFETEVDGAPRPCEHPLNWYHRVAHWAHDRIEAMTFLDRQKWHDRLPDWVCEAYERIEFAFPCRQCEEDRDREYGATIKSDADVIARFPRPWESYPCCYRPFGSPHADYCNGTHEDPLGFDEEDG